MMNRPCLFSAALASLLLVCACQTASSRVPATLENTDESTLSRVKAILADAVGRAQIHLGPEDLSTSTTLSVLPPAPGPQETHSTALPSVFDLVTNGEDCFLVSRNSQESYRLKGIGCRPKPAEAPAP